mmetsp:Transcript_716/g.2081  ORF Transcript_716/g.2081 Transcript_716/m.2081 type:complete len:277 (-) Transcript_716:726-1556(-)
MHGLGLEPLCANLVAELVSQHLVAHKNQNLGGLVRQGAAEVGVEFRLLAVVALVPGLLVKHGDLLDNVRARRGRPVVPLPDGEMEGLLLLVAQALRQLLDLRRPRGREEEHVPVGAAAVPDGRHVAGEPEVEHSVGLVEHEVRYAAQGHVSAVHEVHKSPGRPRDDRAAFRSPQLLAALLAPVHALGPDAARVRALSRLLEELPRLGGDLRGELARRRQHQGDGRRLAPRHRLLRLDVHDRRDQERQRLAAPRPGDAYQVAPPQDDREGLRLDGHR